MLGEPLSGLNPAQRDAVLHGEGPLLVLAGAGSGKTRVLTTRIFNLIREHGVEPSQILAVTFTNKAAGEMRARLTRLLGGEPTGMWVGTFHSIGARLLRANAKYVNRTSAFTIYDEDDIVGTVKRMMEAKGLSVRDLPPKVVHSVISDAKNALVLPSEYAKLASDPLSRAAAQVYNDLERTMQQQNAVDFDDLLLLPVELFRAHPDRLQKYSTMFRYILVDEYQDTNRAQYTLIKLLGSHGNVAVVGDDDQCLVRGTMITMADGAQRPIEAVRPGDLVRSGYGSATFRPARVAAVHERSGIRDGVAIITTGGKRIVSTPEHVHFAGYVPGMVPETYLTLLIHRSGQGYRVGTAQVGGLQQLYRGCVDAVWVISTHASRNAAREDEDFVSLGYGLPMLRDGALRLLADRGLAVDQPHLRPRSRNANRRNVVVTLCGDRRGTSPMHRISMVGNDGEGRDALAAMGLSVRPAKAGSASWRHETANARYDVLFDTVERIRERFDVNLFRVARLGSALLPFTPAGSVMPGMAMFTGDGDYDIVASVERVTITEPVYDLDIDKTHNYIANGIVTHNSIYGWRGADIRNILDFEKDFPDARVVRLEENYRSTQPILDLANVVIEGNTQRLGKTLRTNRRGGERVVLVRAADERDEANFVVDQIVKRRLADRQLALKDFAILYRANAQSRAFEEALRRERTPYRVIGAVRFYDRREVRDVMSYLKLIANPADEEAFRRAITVPRRGVGEQALGQLSEAARGAGVSMLEAAGRPDLVAGLRPGPRAALAEFAVLLGTLREKAVDAGVDELLNAIMSSISYGDVIKGEPDAAERLENLRELIESAAETVIADGGEVGLRPLDHFLQRTSLVAAIDHLDPNADAVSMMTMHNAKGLEFPIVFITGLEDGLFPLRRAIDSPYTKELEEERRLFYVGITRAERTLYLTYADHRRWNGSIMEGIPSRFLKGIPKEMLEQHQTEAARSFGRSAFATFGQPGDRDPESYRPSLRRPGTPVSLARHGPTRFAEEADVSQDAPAYRVGERVKHKTFGSGVIAEMSGAGRELKVRVDFDNPDIGRKTLVAAQAGLEARVGIMAVTFDDVRHIASLARLSVSEERLPALVGELNAILAHMEALQRVDVSGVPADLAAGMTPMPLRADGGEQLRLARPREAFAPDMRDGFYLVPRLATHEDVDE